MQAADPWFEGGANRPSLAEAQRNYVAFGAVERRFVENVRVPDDHDAVDPRWRPLRDSDREYAATPRHIEEADEQSAAGQRYQYWRRGLRK